MGSVTITVVLSEGDCDVAVSKLRALAASGRKIAFDSEYLPAVRKSELVQLCAGNEVFIFRTGRWPSCFESFSSLMSDAAVAKVAHGVGADVHPLQARFPGLVVRGAEELKPHALRAAKTALPNNKLATYVAVLLQQRMPWKAIVNHDLWANETLTEFQLKYAAADALVVHNIVALTGGVAYGSTDEEEEEEEGGADLYLS